MAPAEKKSGENRSHGTLGLTLAVVTGQVGCLTSVILIAAILVGIWLDNHFNSKPLFIVGFLVISVPITLVAMIWIVKKTTAKLQKTEIISIEGNAKEDNISG